MNALPKATGGTFDLIPSDNFDNTRTKDRINDTHTAELVIALCGPIGSPLHDVATAIKNMLCTNFNYDTCSIIRLSELIEKYAPDVDITIPKHQGFEKIQAQINAGNNLRKRYGASILAELAVSAIRLDREQYKLNKNHTNYATRRVCHIIDSIKNQEELDLLRMVYGDMLYVFGVFYPIAQRIQKLTQKSLNESEIYQLIDRDSGEESQTGQTVKDTFPQCDFFLRMDTSTDSQLKERVKRFLHLIMGTKIITPTVNEFAMHAAACAAANSACLSRQVGAAVTTACGEVISTGWNDVPRKGGGLYASSGIDDTQSVNDHRCWNLEGGKCFNNAEQKIFAEQLIYALEQYIVEDKRAEAISVIRSFKKLNGLIEFSRSIHAEMHAILNAGKVAGSKIVGGKLFVTTYPCHSCARHIIASGISDVYYIEPYPKSLAIKLHGDAITEAESDTGKVRLLPYDGVAPSRYLDLFKVRPDTRKAEGLMVNVSASTAYPRLEKSMQAFPNLESIVVDSLVQKNILKVN